MKFGLRIPSIQKRISARLSWKRYVRHSLGLKAPKGFGVITNPKRAMYNYVYNRTSFSMERLFKVGILGSLVSVVVILFILISILTK